MINSCTHSQDAGVRCQPGSYNQSKYLIAAISENIFVLKAVLVETLDLLMVALHWKGELKFAWTMHGAQCVTVDGT